MIKGEAISNQPQYVITFILFFFNRGQDLDRNLTVSGMSPLCYLHGNYRSMNLARTTSQEIPNIINQLKDSCPGHDNIHAKILKLAVHIISPVLSELIIPSYQSGVFQNNPKLLR